MRQTTPTAKSYAGLVTCLRCDVYFASWDRRQNRLCDSCREAIALEPADGPEYFILKARQKPRET